MAYDPYSTTQYPPYFVNNPRDPRSPQGRYWLPPSGGMLPASPPDAGALWSGGAMVPSPAIAPQFHPYGGHDGYQHGDMGMGMNDPRKMRFMSMFKTNREDMPFMNRPMNWLAPQQGQYGQPTPMARYNPNEQSDHYNRSNALLASR